MIWIIYLFVTLWTIIGILALFAPKIAKGFVLKISHGGPFWPRGIIALVIGYLFWQSTVLVNKGLVMQILAIIAIVKGLTFLFAPKSTVNRILNYWMNISDIAFRIFGLVLLVFVYYLFQIIV